MSAALPAEQIVPTSSAGTAATKWTWADLALLMLLLLLAFAIRSRHIDPAPSFDELWHLRLSAGRGLPLNMFAPDVLYPTPTNFASIEGAPPIWRVWTGMDGVLHPPLYVQTLRLWREAFGDGNRVAHLYSIVWNLIAITFTFAAARLAMGRWVAVLVALAMVCSPTQIYFAQEIRAYAMVTGLAAIAVWWMTRIEILGPTRQRAIVLASLTLPLLLTHYFAAGAAIGMAAFGMMRLRGHRTAFLLSLAAAAAIYAVIWLPFALQQINDIGTGDQSWKVEQLDPLGLLRAAANAPFRLIVDRDNRDDPMTIVAGILFVLPWLLIRRLRSLWPWAVFMACSVGFLLALDLIRSTQVVTVTRYLAMASPAVFLLFAGCAAAIRPALGVVTAAGVCLLAVIYLQANTRMASDVQSFGEVPAQIETRGRPGEPLVVYSGALDTFFGDSVLLTCRNSPTYQPRPMMNLTHPMTASGAKVLGPRVWLVKNADEPSPESLIHGTRILWRRMIDFNLFIYYLKLDTGAAPTTMTDNDR